MVRVIMRKGNLKLHISEPFQKAKYKDFMVQANQIAKPYLAYGWHLVFAELT